MSRKSEVSFYKPRLEDLWFRQAMLADPETMSYNNAWGGTIPFPRDGWADWFDGWVTNPDRRFYRYITSGKSRSFVGEAAWHFDEDRRIYLADVIVFARCRGQGYDRAGLELLCATARKAGIRERYDDIAPNNPAVGLFLRSGFREESRSPEAVLLRRTLLSPGDPS